LSVGIGDDGRVLLHCQAGCSTEAILAAMGRTMKDLFPSGNGNGSGRRVEVASYDYRDLDGTLLYQVVRFSPKNFRQRRPDGDGWTWSVKGVKRVPYRVRELVAAHSIFITEGEKDADALHRIGLTATCNAGGAGKWPDELDQYFRPEHEVVILPDNDEPGRKHAELVAEHLKGKVASVKVLHLAGLPEKGDVSDWLRGRDPEGAAEELCKLADGAEEWGPGAEEPEAEYIEFAPAFLGVVDPPIQYLVNELLPSGIMALDHGEPRTRKTWAALEVCIAVATGTPAFGLDRFRTTKPVPVLYSSQEDAAPLVRMRAKALLKGRGIERFPATLAFSVHKGIDLESPEWHRALIRDTIRYGFRLICLDPIRRFAPNADKGPAEVLAVTGFLRRLAVETGATIKIEHHDVKPPNTGRDERRRSHRASGGDWFAACECPVSFEQAGENTTLVVPEDYKLSTDPEPFTVRLETDDPRTPTWARMVGRTESADSVELIEDQKRVLEYLAKHTGGVSGTNIVKGLRAQKERTLRTLDQLLEKGMVDCVNPHKKGKAILWFLRQNGVENE
jgi:hypothetical protein